MTDLSHYTEQNRRAWDEVAHIRHKKFRPASFYAGGGHHLEPKVVAAAGEVDGKTLLHLQCATGEDTLSWSVLGAEATGVDISPRQIELARQKATEAGLSTRFMAADVYNLPPEIENGSFDILFTGGGAIVWLPDIWRWAQIVAAALTPGGRFILFEEHPLAGCLWVEDGHIVIEEDYFGRRPVRYSPGWSHFDDGGISTEPKYEAQWPLGDIITALAQAGLRIESLEEFPDQSEWRFGQHIEEAKRLPGSFLLLAQKDKA